MMGFYEDHGIYIESKDIASCLRDYNLDSILSSAGKITPGEYLYLLSREDPYEIELMARKAHFLTVRNFGKVMQLYSPLYLSNYCVNKCVYCNFHSGTGIKRIKLSSDDIEKEAGMLSSEGFRHVLILTGEDRVNSPLSYIKDSVRILKKYFTSVSIEIYPLEEDEYRELIVSGVDGITVYQEVYGRDIYEKVHPAGPKNDYMFRLNAPERAARAGMRTINIGALLGLNDFMYESFITALHAGYLQDRYPSSEISVSMPRLRPYGGEKYPAEKVSDKDLVKIITALRIFLPRVGITLSTREDEKLRDNLMPLGVTKMSASSDTRVGGRIKESSSDPDDGQFAISDKRSISELKAILVQKGYQPVHQDWPDLKMRSE